MTILLTPAEELALQVIEARRRSRRADRDSPSEVVSDAIWKLLNDLEGLTKEQVEALPPEAYPVGSQSNLREFPK